VGGSNQTKKLTIPYMTGVTKRKIIILHLAGATKL